MPDQTTTELDAVMEEAGVALAKMDYLTCESLCLQALTQARKQKDWAMYGRILMPLQETRRQRRMIAAEGSFRFGTASLDGSPETWLDQCDSGAIVVTHPHDMNVATELMQATQNRRQFIEILFADSGADASVWTLRSFAGPETKVEIQPPPSAWRDRWLTNLDVNEEASEPAGASNSITLTPGAWIIDATEQLGDAALAATADMPVNESLIIVLEDCLRVVVDHELLHQRLSGAVKAVRLQSR